MVRKRRVFFLQNLFATTDGDGEIRGKGYSPRRSFSAFILQKDETDR